MGWCPCCGSCRQALARKNPCYLCTCGQNLHHITHCLIRGIYTIAGLRMVLAVGHIALFGYRAKQDFRTYFLLEKKDEEEHLGQQETDEKLLGLYYLSVWNLFSFAIMFIHYLFLIIGAGKRSRLICFIWMLAILPYHISILIKLAKYWFFKPGDGLLLYQLIFWITSTLVQYWELWVVLIYYDELKRGEEVDLGKVDAKEEQFTEVDNDFDKVLKERLEDHDELEEAFGFRTSWEYAEAIIWQTQQMRAEGTGPPPAAAPPPTRG